MEDNHGSTPRPRVRSDYSRSQLAAFVSHERGTGSGSFDTGTFKATRDDSQSFKEENTSVSKAAGTISKISIYSFQTNRTSWDTKDARTHTAHKLVRYCLNSLFYTFINSFTEYEAQS